MSYLLWSREDQAETNEWSRGEQHGDLSIGWLPLKLHSVRRHFIEVADATEAEFEEYRAELRAR
jgi:hypothetical protein